MNKALNPDQAFLKAPPNTFLIVVGFGEGYPRYFTIDQADEIKEWLKTAHVDRRLLPDSEIDRVFATTEGGSAACSGPYTGAFALEIARNGPQTKRGNFKYKLKAQYVCIGHCAIRKCRLVRRHGVATCEC